MRSSEILKTKQTSFRYLLSKRARRGSDTVRVVPEAYVLKLSIFVAQRLTTRQFREKSVFSIFLCPEAGLTSKWDTFWPVVQW